MSEKTAKLLTECFFQYPNTGMVHQQQPLKQSILNDTEYEQFVVLASVVSQSVVDGVGIRYTIFTQGCTHNCKGCHNAHTHALDGGENYSIESIIKKIKDNPLLDGITLSGGEPFLQPQPLVALCKQVHKLNQNVWCYTGFTYEQLLKNGSEKTSILDLLNEIDILVDGPFIEEQKNLLKRFKGSENQRIINLKKMRETNSIDIIVLE